MTYIQTMGLGEKVYLFPHMSGVLVFNPACVARRS